MTQTINQIDLIKEIVEAALYNEKTLAEATRDLKENVERLNRDVSESITKSVTNCVVQAVSDLIIKAGPTIANSALKVFSEATDEAQKARAVYEAAAAAVDKAANQACKDLSEAAGSLTSEAQRIIWVSVIASSVVSLVVSTICVLLIRR